jgi:hypothetical protein
VILPPRGSDIALTRGDIRLAAGDIRQSRVEKGGKEKC